MDALDAEQAAIYKSGTRRAPAEITFADGKSISGEIHLQLNATLPEGYETPVELLNREEAFYAVTLDSGTVALLSKAQTALVVLTKESPPPDPQNLPGFRSAQLDIHLASGPQVRGWAMWQLPPGKGRSLDYLNSAGNFLEISDENTTWCINRSLIDAVYPLD